jgi:hypothetical protein
VTLAFRACEVLLASVVESQRPSDIRAFVREAVIRHLGLR